MRAIKTQTKMPVGVSKCLLWPLYCACIAPAKHTHASPYFASAHSAKFGHGAASRQASAHSCFVHVIQCCQRAEKACCVHCVRNSWSVESVVWMPWLRGQCPPWPANIGQQNHQNITSQIIFVADCWGSPSYFKLQIHRMTTMCL